IARSRSAGSSRVTSRSPIRIRPEVTFSRPPIERSSVVFPQPDGPTSTRNSPSPIVRLTSLTARTFVPNAFVTWSRTISPTARPYNDASGAAIVATREPPSLDSAMAVGALCTAVAPNVLRFRDTCNVYVLRAEGEAVLVDFGDGAVLDHLDELEVERVTDV